MIKLASAVFALILFFTFAGPAHSDDYSNSSTVAAILDSAEKFFLYLKNRQYSPAWELLSEKTQETIINDVYKEFKKLGGKSEKNDITKDFENNGPVFNNYWDAFLRSFDPRAPLEESQWKMGFVKKHKAEILITNNKADMPAKLKMFRENNTWKVGLVETFWLRKKIEFFQ
jgi:hypothetical protein